MIFWLVYRVAVISVYIFNFLFHVVVPVAVLVINMIALREVRRASKHSVANLGLQQHRQSTSSNSAVPTVMLITTSFIYVFLFATWDIIYLVCLFASASTQNALYSVGSVLGALVTLVCAYNFYVYLITGKQFRSELYKLFCYCSTSFSAAAAITISSGDDGNDARIARHAPK